MSTKKVISSFAFLLIVFSCSNVFSQQMFYTVKGKVIDKNTKAPLPGASVFAQNTTFGEATNTDGDFTLRIPNGGYSLVASFTGYETGTIRISNTSAEKDSLVFELNPQEKSLEAVTIAISNEVKDGWQKYGEFFTNNFIGQSKFAKQCIIKNPEALHFYFSKKRNRLKVTATEPLVVNNFALGYNLKFAIDSFTNEYNTNTNLFIGYPLFEAMQGTPEQEKTWNDNRAAAYKGSMLQLMRSIYSKTLDQNGFELQFIVKNNDKEMPIKLGNIYGALNYDKDDSTNTVDFMPNQNEVAVIYNDAKPEETYLDSDSSIKKDFQLSTLLFAPGESITIEQNGYYYDQEDITTNGYLAFKKIGDMLPYNYEPE
ncbi:MAG: carboxypeptidase-like regulatory domain-containing protein [Bacteroidota bacterium]|nr:carboxypeptidase-like regulatory domain-containing protein [Bacteroidota bacterium]